MPLLIGLIVLSIAGIGAVFWMLKNETDSGSPVPITLDAEDHKPAITPLASLSEPQEPSAEPLEAPKVSPLIKLGSLFKKNPMATGDLSDMTTPSQGPLTKLFQSFKLKNLKSNNLGIGKESDEDQAAPKPTHFASLRDYFGEKSQPAEPPKSPTEEKIQSKYGYQIGRSETGTSSLLTEPVLKQDQPKPLPEVDEKKIDREIELSTEITELKDKVSRFESMLKEKNTALETAQSALDNELKNRKDFNKVKDVLEKELKDTKDKSRNIQVELTKAQSEAERHSKRVILLEEKVARLEKEMLQKEDRIDELVKRLQTFASPTTASTPPIKERDEGGLSTAAKAETPPPPQIPEPPQPSKIQQDTVSAPKTSVPEPGPIEVPLEKPKAADKPEPQTGTSTETIENTSEIQASDIPAQKNIPQAIEVQPAAPQEQPDKNSGSDIDLSEPEFLTEPEDGPTENNETKDQDNAESFLKLKPDVLSDAPDQNNTEQNPAIEKPLFKIIDPNDLPGSGKPD